MKSLKKLYYILLSFFESIFYDFKSSYDNMAKPKEILNILFWVSVILVFTERWEGLKYALGLYMLVYLWKVIRQGDWRRKMKEKTLEKRF